MKDFDADVFFPPIDLSRFSKVADSGILSDPQSSLSYSFVDYILKPVLDSRS